MRPYGLNVAHGHVGPGPSSMTPLWRISAPSPVWSPTPTACHPVTRWLKRVSQTSCTSWCSCKTKPHTEGIQSRGTGRSFSLLSFIPHRSQPSLGHQPWQEIPWSVPHCSAATAMQSLWEAVCKCSMVKILFYSHAFDHNFRHYSHKYMDYCSLLTPHI